MKETKDSDDSTEVLPKVADPERTDDAQPHDAQAHDDAQPHDETQLHPAARPGDDRIDADLPAVLAAAAPHRWWNRTTLVLLALALPAAGFLGGVLAHQHWGEPTGTTTARTGPGGGLRAPARPSDPGRQAGGASFGPGSGRPGGGTSGGGFPGADPAAATVGTLTSVANGTLTVRTMTGATVTVRLAEGTKIQQATTVDKLTAGQGVTVQGTTGTDGTVTATTVTTG